jgi:hypothetical protein
MARTRGAIYFLTGCHVRNLNYFRVENPFLDQFCAREFSRVTAAGSVSQGSPFIEPDERWEPEVIDVGGVFTERQPGLSLEVHDGIAKHHRLHPLAAGTGGVPSQTRLSGVNSRFNHLTSHMNVVTIS